MNNIQRTSQRYVVLTNILIVSVPLITFLYWVGFNALPDGFHAHLPARPQAALAAWQIALALLVSALPTGVGLFGLITLRTLFRLYATGQVFTARNVTCFRRLGYALIAWVAASILFTPLISLVLSAANPQGQRSVVAELGVSDFAVLFIGGVVLIVAAVMDRACEMEAEQAYTI